MPLYPFRRRDDSEDREYAPAVVPPPPRGAAGVDGDQYSDYYDSIAGGTDLNPTWTGRNKYETIEEMRKSDPAIHSLLWMFKLPGREAEWTVKPFRDGDDPTDRLIAAAVECQFGLGDYEGWLDLSHDEQLNIDSLMLDFGAMFEEICWGDPVTFVPLDSIDTAGDGRLLKPISRLAPRFPATVDEIKTDKRTGKLTSIRQDLPDALPIPGENLVPYVLERESSWFGTSLLRYCYGAWRLKRALMIAAGIGWDRYSSGVPLVRYPAATPGAKQEAEAIGRNVRTHERAYVALEGTPADGWDFKIESGAQSLADPTDLLRHFDVQIANAGLQGFKELGNTATGARATADVTQMPYWKAVTAIFGHIARTRRKYAIRRFVDVNFGPRYQTPELEVSNIEAEDIATLAEIITNLSSAGFTFTDRETQDDIRDRLKLRHLPEEVATAVDKLPDQAGLTTLPTVPPVVPREGDPIIPPAQAG